MSERMRRAARRRHNKFERRQNNLLLPETNTAHIQSQVLSALVEQDQRQLLAVTCGQEHEEIEQQPKPL